MKFTWKLAAPFIVTFVSFWILLYVHAHLPKFIFWLTTQEHSLLTLQVDQTNLSSPALILLAITFGWMMYAGSHKDNKKNSSTKERIKRWVLFCICVGILLVSFTKVYIFTESKIFAFNMFSKQHVITIDYSEIEHVNITAYYESRHRRQSQCQMYPHVTMLSKKLVINSGLTKGKTYDLGSILRSHGIQTEVIYYNNCNRSEIIQEERNLLENSFDVRL